MKKIFVLILFLSGAYHVSAQQSVPKIYIQPEWWRLDSHWKFCQRGLCRSNIRIRQYRGSFNLTGTQYFNNNLGIMILAGYSSFGKNGTQSLADGYKEDSGTDSTTLYTKGSNYSLSFLIGPAYRIISGEHFFVDARALIGYVSSHLAGFQIFYEDYTTNSMTQNESSAGAFGFQGDWVLAIPFPNSGLFRLMEIISRPNQILPSPTMISW